MRWSLIAVQAGDALSTSHALGDEYIMKELMPPSGKNQEYEVGFILSMKRFLHEAVHRRSFRQTGVITALFFKEEIAVNVNTVFGICPNFRRRGLFFGWMINPQRDRAVTVEPYIGYRPM